MQAWDTELVGTEVFRAMGCGKGGRTESYCFVNLLFVHESFKQKGLGQSFRPYISC